MPVAVSAPAPPSLVDLAAELLNPRRVEVARDPAPWSASGLVHHDTPTDIRRAQRDHIRALVWAGRGDEARRLRAAYASARDSRPWVPPLLVQVCDSIESSRGTGRRSGRGAHRAPATLDAVDLVAEVERHAGRGPRVELPHRVWAWVRVHGTDDQAPDLVASWLSRARAIVEPPRPIGLAAACPRCRARTVTVEDHGERVRRTALQVDRTTGVARCGACGEEWGPEYLEHLAAVLEQQRAEEEANRSGSRAGVDTLSRGGGLTQPPGSMDHPGHEG